MATSARSLPAGPRLPPVLQTLRWLVRPIAFLEACRRDFGDAFSVRFLGFERPMVMLSDPETIRVLYKAPEHTLPPGRTLALRRGQRVRRRPHPGPASTPTGTSRYSTKYNAHTRM